MAEAEFLCPLNIQIKDRSFFKIGPFTVRNMTDADREVIFGIKDYKHSIDAEGKESFSCTGPIYNEKTYSLFSFTEEWRMIKAPSVIEFENDQDAPRIRSLLLAFRLYKSGTVFAPLVVRRSSPSINTFKAARFCKGSKAYKLEKSDVEQVSNIFEWLREVKKDSPAALALEKFSFAIDEQTNDKNSYIEFVSILESLFLDNNAHELSFRFALLISYILSNELETTVSFKEVKEMYVVRSELVHGGNSKRFSDKKLEELNEHVRKLIVWYLKKKKYSYEETQTEIFRKLSIAS